MKIRTSGGVFLVVDVCGQGGGEGYKIAEILRTSFMFLMKSYINVPVDSSFKP